MPAPRYLTKSRFKLGLDCETKLFYTGKKDEYLDENLEDEFLLALAEGGFQVGELAKYMICDNPETDTVETLDYEKALAETTKRLAASKATVAEAAFRFGNLFIRADIVVKRGKTLELYEVKAKSWDGETEFWGKKDPKKLNSEWREYLYDIAFQTYVVEKACPGFKVIPHLILANKEATASVDGLNQMFKIMSKGEGKDKRTFAQAKSGLKKSDLGKNILATIDVGEDIRRIRKLKIVGKDADGIQYSFEAFVEHLAELYGSDQRQFTKVGKRCKGCQFGYNSRTPAKAKAADQGKKNGFCACWRQQFGQGFDFTQDTVLDLWKFLKADDLIEKQTVYLKDLEPGDVGSGKSSQRQWLQAKKVKENDTTPWLDLDALAAEMGKWNYPLHFIDFETSMSALPFNAGRRPYEQIAFQFSHHRIQEDGKIEHKGQWLAEAGYFPNFDFVRQLKQELEQDDGTIFRYASHENTVLNQIYDQLGTSQEADRQELMEWIRTITYRKDGNKMVWEGPRNMVDMCELVQLYHYEPATHGSNSIKAVLPAIIASSAALRKKYGKAIYGTPQYSSLNFPKTGHAWIDKGHENNPYKTLPPLFADEESRELSEEMERMEGIDNGGAALVAFAKLQFEKLSPASRKQLRDGLLRYCELDTFAMVMLYEYWQEKLAAR